MEKNSKSKTPDEIELIKCGIVMPISEIDGCSSEHWDDVLQILKSVILNIGFEPNLVSDSDDIGVIQKRIVQNIYNNPIIVCDVSARNPNVMFELGLRLAFDKPTIIIKDDKTAFSFDTSVIEHISYPRDLRFNKIVEFKEELSKKIKATYEHSINDPHYSTFLKSFGEFKVAKLHQQEVSKDEYLLEAISDLTSEIRRMKNDSNVRINSAGRGNLKARKLQEMLVEDAIFDFMKEANIKTIANLKKNISKVSEFVVENKNMPHFFDTASDVKSMVAEIIEKM